MYKVYMYLYKEYIYKIKLIIIIVIIITLLQFPFNSIQKLLIYLIFFAVFIGGCDYFYTYTYIE